MRGTRLLSLVLCLSLSIAGCIKKGPLENADGTLGAQPRTYYHVDSSAQISIVQVINAGVANSLGWDRISSLSPLGSIDPQSYRISQDGKILTVTNDPVIYEYQPVDPTKIGQPGVTIAASTVSSVCYANPAGQTQLIGNTGYQELHIMISSTGYKLIAVEPDLSETKLNPQTLASKQSSPTQVVYSDSTFGSITLDLSQPSSGDPRFFKATVAGSSVQWNSVSNLYCHSNSIPVTNSGGGGNNGLSKPLVSSSAQVALTGGQRFFDGAPWKNPVSAMSPDGLFATSQGKGNYNSSNLKLMGFFADPSQMLPADAIIDGIGVNCMWGTANASGSANDHSIQLMVGNQAKGSDLSSNQAIPFPMGMSATYGGSNSTWGLSLTPAQVNDLGFGVQIQIHSNNGVDVNIDYCQMTVTWR